MYVKLFLFLLDAEGCNLQQSIITIFLININLRLQISLGAVDLGFEPRSDQTEDYKSFSERSTKE
jgi:hypothetical protein